MGDRQCEECGFYYTDVGSEKCHISKEAIEQVKTSECKRFITRRFDGNEPFTPEEHEWLYQQEINSKKMTNMQGLRFK